MFIYPITIVLILLNVLPEKYSSSKIFKAVIVTTILFSIPDFLESIGFVESIASVKELIPLGAFSMGWVLPAGLVFVLVNVLVNIKNEL